MENTNPERIRIHRLETKDAPIYESFAFRSHQPYLLHCEQKNIIALGAETLDGAPCGLMIALTAYIAKDEISDRWTLLSVYVSEGKRRGGVAAMLWKTMKSELHEAGCSKVRTQAVLRENNADATMAFLEGMGFQNAKRVAKIFGFSQESIKRSVFVRGAMAEDFRPDTSFLYRSFEELSEEELTMLRENEGEWYPPFVNPLIGAEQYNRKCTVFAYDPAANQIAGWITVLNVNDSTRLLYRTFFTREEYRNTPVGFHLFTQAIKNNLRFYPERCGLSSIPTENEKAMRFSELFFKDAVDYVSYEITADFAFH